MLGMDWLNIYYTTIDCKSMVTFRSPGQESSAKVVRALCHDDFYVSQTFDE